jgi:hypothetical protein
MKREKTIHVMLTDQEYKEFIANYAKQLTTGNCTTKSNYIRQMLGLNGTKPPSDALPDKNPETNNEIANEVINKEADKTASQLSIDFGKLDI